MGRYRYRTCVLVGPWRESPEEAAEDAIRSRQARPNDGGGGLSWSVPGMIEERSEADDGQLPAP